MKISKRAPSTIKNSNSVGKSYSFGFKENEIIAELLRSKLYAHPKRTLVQEYLANARDAQREVGHPNKPFLVTLPSEEDPTLKIRDYGPGLSENRLLNVFLNYGSSTKRGNNNQTGGYGIGAKSAWAYTDSFVVISYINGTATHYLAHLAKSKVGTLEVLKNHETNESNGTEIQIGVEKDDIDEFIDAVFRATVFWETKPVIENIKKDSDYEKYRDVKPAFKTKEFSVFKRSDLAFLNSTLYQEFDGIFAIVDGIPYSLSETLGGEAFSQLNDLIVADYLLGIHIKTGQVTLNVGREEISNSPKTKKTLSVLLKNAINKINNLIPAQLEDCSTAKDFFSRLHLIYDCFDVQRENLTYKGADESISISRGIVSSPTLDLIKRSAAVWERKRLIKDTRANPNIKAQFGALMFVDEVIGPGKLQSKVKNFIKELGSEYPCYLFTPSTDKEIKFLEQAGAIPTSSMLTPVIQRSSIFTNMGVRVPRNQSDIVINRVIPSGSSWCEPKIQKQTINGTNLKKEVFVYISQKAFQSSSKKYFNKIALFFVKRKTSFCYMTPRMVQWSTKYSNFITIQDYISRLTDKEIQDLKDLAKYSVLSEIWSNFKEKGIPSADTMVKDLSKMVMESSVLLKLKDKKLNEGFKDMVKLSSIYQKVERGSLVKIPSLVLLELYRRDSDLLIFKKTYEDFYSHIAKKYYLALQAASSGHSKTSSKTINELGYYFNSKEKYGK